MKRLAASLALVLLFPLVALASEGHSGAEGFTKHYANSLFEVTENGLYSVEMLVLGGELSVGMNTLDIIVHDAKDSDVMGADITVTPWMPDMGHGVKEQPVITERGGGLYSVENVEISMPGLWELRVQVDRGGQEDVAVFSFPGVHAAGAAMEEHMPTHMMVPEGLNVSHIRMSEGGAFRAAFVSEPTPSPINKVHGWMLYVETADGTPVTDAEITISGDMPEHGHGMPTKPRVARNLGGGVYDVEGMKFQMPGWWVVNFTISSGGVEDRVTFNLQLR
ncbi:MAG: FixH family protein [Nitrospirota bacterium]|jgi:hypothetical protein